MNADETIQDDIKESMSFENAPKQPRFRPAVPKRVVGNVFARLRGKRIYGERFLMAVEFAGQLVGVGKMKSKVMQISVQQQYDLSTREARRAVRAAKPKRHRRR